MVRLLIAGNGGATPHHAHERLEMQAHKGVCWGATRSLEQSSGYGETLRESIAKNVLIRRALIRDNQP
ncbi:MAG: hypothetical protein CME12_07330 [Gemmatimonadetes bacterium]|nr:hypothetical protein [Gemmatimonadota bacterium]